MVHIRVAKIDMLFFAYAFSSIYFHCNCKSPWLFISMHVWYIRTCVSCVPMHVPTSVQICVLRAWRPDAVYVFRIQYIIEYLVFWSVFSKKKGGGGGEGGIRGFLNVH